jgi:hypothetical protein
MQRHLIKFMRLIFSKPQIDEFARFARQQTPISL